MSEGSSFSLPPKPIISPAPKTVIGRSTPSSSTLPTRPFGLPQKPDFHPSSDPSRSRAFHSRSPSPEYRREIDSYRPRAASPPREADSYIADPSPPRRSRKDTYLPSPSPPPRRRRSPSPVYSRYRSPSPRRYSERRYSSYSPSRSRSPSPPRSARNERATSPGRKSLKERLGGFAERPKRSASPPVDPPPAKVSKPSIPTGPKVIIKPRPVPVPIPFGSTRSFGTKKPIPTGPKAALLGDTDTGPPIPTGPAAYRAPAETESDMPKPRQNGTRRPTPPARSVAQLAGPQQDSKAILAAHPGITLKPQWAENPKAPLANYLGGGTGGATLNYEVEEGMIGGKKLFRVSVVVDSEQGVIGVGDHPIKKEAEKLAALSAVVQLCAAGLLEKGKPGKSPMAPVAAPAAGETAKLSDGSEISYDRARQFMDYYCQRYKFGKPDIEFTQTTTKGGKKGRSGAMVWDAVMTVGGKVIGMGQASNKKAAQIKTYLDVTQYLESCDPELWRDFVEHSKKDPMANLGLAPHLVFQMSDSVNDEITAMSDDIRRSTLYKNAPTSGASDQQAMPTWHSGRGGAVTEDQLRQKSLALQEKLDTYQTDPNLEKMRAQRASLPVAAQATDILAKIEVNDVTIVMAATGSGKTTQVPQLLFDDYINRGEGAKCNVLCTQPRRLAAMSVAERIADERGDRLGVEVGYQVRFDAKLPEPHGSITFCTTGIFLKRMQSALGATADPQAVEAMDRVTHIVVDEVHERDIDTDLSLVVLKRLLADRKARKKPLKVVLMSATIDPTLFQRYFIDARGRPAPVAEIPGRTFPVSRHYLDEIIPDMRTGLQMQNGGWVFQEKNVVDYLTRELSHDRSAFNPLTGIDLEIPYPLVALTIAHVLKESDDGHVLVFLPGWEEIKKVADILLDSTGRRPLGLRFTDANKYSVHYLHSTIPAAEQKEVFRPPPKGVRRIILATNIAETSITIPDVVFVVDSARVKEKRYDPERHMSSLVSAWVGSSNLGQRAGRAGRHREGEYFGLLSKNRYETLEKHQTVEMKRSDLSNVVMHVKALNLGEVEDVLAAVIEPPEPSRIVSAMETLRMLGAMDLQQNLTSLGKVLLQLPVEAAIGKLCLYGSFFRCLDSALTLAAILTNRDPFLAPITAKQQADEIKDSWSPVSFRSDPFAIWAAFNAWSRLDDMGSYHAANSFASENFLSKPTLLQIKQVKGSLLQSLDSAGVIAVSAGGSVRRLGRRQEIPKELRENDDCLPLLAALIAMSSAPNFALRTSEKTCRTAKDKVVFIHASSVNSRRRETAGPNMPSTSFNPAEKRLYAFSEKTRNVPPGSNPSAAITQLRGVTRLDPMTYMLFGAYNLVVTQRGLECDGWLPVTGNLYGLDDVQRLKGLLERCMLRVFEGVGKSLTRGRDERWRDARKTVQTNTGGGSSRIQGGEEDEQAMEDGEMESDDEHGDGVETNGNGTGGVRQKQRQRIVQPLSLDEIKELDLLTSDVVRILNMYAMEREGGSVVASRPQTPGGGARTPVYAGGGGGGGSGARTPVYGGSGGSGAGGVYQAPGKRW